MARKVYPNPESTFIWRFYKQDEADVFKRFSNIAVFENKTVNDLLFDLVEKHVSGKKHVPELVQEKILISELKKEKIDANRMMLKKFRENDSLKNGNKKLWFTDGRHIRYDLKGCTAFFQKKKDSGKNGKK